MTEGATSPDGTAITPRGLALEGEVPEAFDTLATARRVLRTARSGALATLDPASGFPLSTLVNVATDGDGSPLLLVSRLALHTRNIEADPRVSIMVMSLGKGDPLAASERLSLVGRVARCDTPGPRARFLARHPKARLYADFPDFALYRLELEAAHLNGGFARAGRLEAGELLLDPAACAALAAIEPLELERLNTDHAASLGHMAGAAGGRWRATGLDPEGIDLIGGDQAARILFPAAVDGAETVRAGIALLEASLDRDG